MSADRQEPSSGPAGAGPGEASRGAGTPSEEELRAAYEAELSRISSTEMILQATVSLLNLGARRLAPRGPGQAPGPGGDAAMGGDLDQTRDAIDAVRALLEILERRIPGQLRSLRDALSQLQMAYAREIQPGAGAGEPARSSAGAGQARSDPAAGGAQTPPPGAEEAEGERPPGPAETSGRLWVPGR